MKKYIPNRISWWTVLTTETVATIKINIKNMYQVYLKWHDPKIIILYTCHRETTMTKYSKIKELNINFSYTIMDQSKIKGVGLYYYVSKQEFI